MKKLRLLFFSSLGLAIVGVVLMGSNGINRSAANAQQDGAAMEIAVTPDQRQFTDPAVPVIVVRTVSGSSEPDADAKKQYLVKEVILENRSTKDISSVSVRWVIAPMNSKSTSLARGELSPNFLKKLNKTLKAGQRQTLKLSHPKLGLLVQQIPDIGSMGNKFIFLFGVAEVLFEDGTSWKEGPD